MKLRRHSEPTLGLAFDYPETWAVERGNAFQIVNQQQPHGAITISLLLSGPLGGSAQVRFAYADRKSHGTPPKTESWTFVGSTFGGAVTYCHDGSDEEAREAAVIIDSLVIGPPAPARRRGLFQRLFG